jgi:uncharacterized MAPEG superfamily protein
MLTTDLQMLVASGLLAFVLAMLPQVSRIGKPGFTAWNAGNRERPFEGTPAWGQRAARAHENLLENLGLFTIAVLVVHVSGSANAASAQGAVIFFVARVVHAVLYTAGITYLRTLAFGVSLAGVFRVLGALWE